MEKNIRHTQAPEQAPAQGRAPGQTSPAGHAAVGPAAQASAPSGAGRAADQLSAAQAPDQPPSPGKAPEPHRKLWVVLVVLLVLLIAAAAALFVWLTTPNPDRDGLQPDPNVKVGSLSGDFADLDKIVDEGMLTFSINATPAFPDGTSPGNLMIENAEINNNRFTVAIYRTDTGEKVYESGYLDPGQYIEEAPLDVDLAAGTYPCTAQFSTYKLSDNTPIGQAAAEITVYVQG